MTAPAPQPAGTGPTVLVWFCPNEPDDRTIGDGRGHQVRWDDRVPRCVTCGVCGPAAPLPLSPATDRADA